MKSITKISLAALWVAMIAACGSPKSTTPDISTVDRADVVAADTNAGEMDPTQEYEMPESPKAKSEADQKAVRALWDKAIANEKKYLSTPRIEKWVAGLKETTDEEGIPVYGKLDDKQFKSLTAKELVYYIVFHPESWDQICAEFLYDAGLVQGVSIYLPMNGDYLSERQDAAAKANADSVKSVILSSLAANQTVSEPMLHTISALGLKAAVGPLCDIYKAQMLKDDLILSAMIELMNNAQFKPWLESELLKEMNGKSREWIPLTPENADKIMFFAKKYAAS